MGNTKIVVTTGAVSVGSCGAFIVTSSGITGKVSGSAFEFESTKESAYATVYLKYYNKVTQNQKPVSATNYDYKFVVTCVDTQQIAASSIKITNVFDGNVEKVGKASSSAITEKDIEVKATVAGVETKLDPAQYIIKSVDNGGFTTEEQNKGVKTKTATVTIQATTFDSDNNPTVTELKSDYTISYDDAYATDVSGKVYLLTITATAANGKSVTKDFYVKFK